MTSKPLLEKISGRKDRFFFQSHVWSQAWSLWWPISNTISISLHRVEYKPLTITCHCNWFWYPSRRYIVTEYQQSIPDESYSRNASCALTLISTFLFPFTMNIHVSRDVIINIMLMFVIQQIRYLAIIITLCMNKYSNLFYISYIYNIGVFMWRGLETGERRALESFSIRFVPSHIHYIFTVNTPILYLSYNTICQIKCYLI